MTKYGYPLEINEKCWIRQIAYECKQCRNTFIHELPIDIDVIKLIEKDGTDIRWLPRNGIGGFLDIVKKLAPGLANEPFGGVGSIKLERLLEIKLPEHTERGNGGNGFIIGGSMHICPKCKSKELKEIEEKVIENHKLHWIKISCDLLETTID